MSPSSRAGLVLLGLLSAIDLFLPLLTDGETPPMGVALVAAALGLASLALIVSVVGTVLILPAVHRPVSAGVR